MLFSGNQSFLYAVNPILAICSLVALDDLDIYISFKQSLWGISTVVVFGFFYFLNVVVLKVWNDFYFFYNNSVVHMIIAMIGMLLGVSGISFGEFYLRKILQKILIGGNDLEKIYNSDDDKLEIVNNNKKIDYKDDGNDN